MPVDASSVPPEQALRELSEQKRQLELLEKIATAANQMTSLAEVLQFAHVATAYPGSWFWRILALNQTHAQWTGCSLHDTIQPGFSFLVGVALPYSIASRLARGENFGKLFAHALWRSLLLISLGIFLRSMAREHTYFTFEDTLSQIGLGYPFLFLLGFRPRRWAW